MILISTFLLALALSLCILLLFNKKDPDQALLRARSRALHAPQAIAAKADNNLLAAKKLEAWSTSLLARWSITASLQAKWTQLLLQSQASIPLSKLLTQSAGLATTTTLCALPFLPHWLAPIAGAAAASIPILILHLKRKRRIAAFNAALPDVIDMMSRSLRAGHALVAALSIVAEQASEPARTEFTEVFRKQSFGLPLREALYQLLARVPSQDLRVLVTGILVQKDTGGNLAEILDRIVAVIRQRLKIQGEIRTHTAQGRLTGWILCLLPIVMMIAINLINPGYSKPLTDNDFGRKLLIAGSVLLTVGALLIRRIVNSIEV